MWRALSRCAIVFCVLSLFLVTACQSTCPQTCGGSHSGKGENGQAEPGDKRFDRFACYNFSGALATFRITVTKADGVVVQNIDINVKPGFVGGRVLDMRGDPVVQTVECEILSGAGAGLKCHVDTTLPQGLRSVAFWLGQDVASTPAIHLCASGLDANHEALAEHQD